MIEMSCFFEHDMVVCPLVSWNCISVDGQANTSLLYIGVKRQLAILYVNKIYNNVIKDYKI